MFVGVRMPSDSGWQREVKQSKLWTCRETKPCARLLSSCLDCETHRAELISEEARTSQ